MDNNLFDDLVASIKEAGAIKRKEIKASRTTELKLPDIKQVREKNRFKSRRICRTSPRWSSHPTKLGTRPTLSNRTSGNINSNFRCTS